MGIWVYLKVNGQVKARAVLQLAFRGWMYGLTPIHWSTKSKEQDKRAPCTSCFWPGIILWPLPPRGTVTDRGVQKQ